MLDIQLPQNNARRIDGKSVFKLYLQLKGHFNGKYDVVKYNWSMKLSDAAYNKRRDKMFFERLSSRHTLKDLCLIFISNLVANQDAWIGEISDADALIFYREYLGRLSQVQTRYQEDIRNIYYFSEKIGIKALQDIFVYNENISTSYVFKLLQNDIISFETFILLDSFLDIINNMDKHDDIVWESYSKRLNGYRKILTVDSAKAKQLFVETIKSCKQ